MSAEPLPHDTTGQPTQPAAVTVGAAGWRDWLSFLLQAVLVVGVEVGDDAVRGLLLPSDRWTAVADALRLVRVESALGLWIEPGLQSFFQQPHRLWHACSCAPKVVENAAQTRRLPVVRSCQVHAIRAHVWCEASTSSDTMASMRARPVVTP